METLALDSKAFDAAIRAGQGPRLLRDLERRGIVFHDHQEWLSPGIAKDDFNLAMDVQSELVTVSNAGIPAFLANYLDPKVIETLLTPMKAAIIAGEVKKGDWTTETAMFMVVESVGQVSSYGDYSQDGISNANAVFPQRQNYIYQAFLQYGEREVAIAGLAKLDWVTRQQNANALVLNKYQNDTYFFGVSGIQNYGLLNDPTLPASITPQFSWLTNASATANTIYQDIVRLYIQVQGQANGTVDMDARMVLAMSPQQAVSLKNVTLYNTNSVEDLLKKNFPNMRIETAVQYSTASGQLVQLIVEELEGQRTLEAAFSEKMRAHQMVVDSSSWRQKRSQGSFGTIIYRPFLIASMVG
ncbi:MAG: hypothetical protein ACRD3Q_00365 [Terriglobales bacterium]